MRDPILVGRFVREEAIQAGLTDAETFDAGIRGLLRTAEPDGVFCYTFFKATGFKASVTE